MTSGIKVYFSEAKKCAPSLDRWMVRLKVREAEHYTARGSGYECLRVRLTDATGDYDLWHIMPIEGRDKSGVPNVTRLAQFLMAAERQENMVLEKLRAMEQRTGQGVDLDVVIDAVKTLEWFYALVEWDHYMQRDYLRIASWVPQYSTYGPKIGQEPGRKFRRTHNEQTGRTTYWDDEGNVLAADVESGHAWQFEVSLEEQYGRLDWQTSFVPEIVGVTYDKVETDVPPIDFSKDNVRVSLKEDGELDVEVSRGDE